MMIPKRSPIRSKTYREAAHGQDCTMWSPWCNGFADTVQFAHSDWGEDGKGKAQKADDVFGADICNGCHSWLHNSKASREEKRDYFHRAMKRTIRRRYDMGLLSVKGAA
ncbi:nuclease domain-containing protein [Arhodomonas sp. AD133]|uniref:nuclease domain-containing protein n=1 Tax=Arhodomonas sp. AD133 TaxID=3415009 RepID=UPI003EBBD7E2